MRGAEMLLLVLMLLLGLTLCLGFVFNNSETELYDGDPCTLSNGGIGQCQLMTKCGKPFSDFKRTYGFIGLDPIVCCDVVRRQCEGVDRRTSKNLIPHIVGNAEKADVGEFPFIALITYRYRSEADEEVPHIRCGAALVSKRFLLTAAHCIINDTNLVIYSVKLGTVDADDPQADSYLIDTVYRHESFKRRQNDIGIVKLVEDVSLNANIKPICIYTNPEDLSESMDLTVMGWGEANGEVSDVLLKGTVQPMSRTTCQARFDIGSQRIIKLQDTHVCALGGKNENGTATDTCQGDSGGPMVLEEDDEKYLVAIVSTGGGCGAEHYAGVYTRVYHFLPWIIEKGVFRNP